MAEKNIIRKARNKDNPYAQIYKGLLFDRKLSYKARGLAAYILGKPDDWIVIVSDLINNSEKDGETSVRNGIKELVEQRYLQRYPIYVNAKVAMWESLLSEEAYSEVEMIKSIKYRLIDFKTVSKVTAFKNDKECEEKLLLENLKVATDIDATVIELLLENLKVGNVQGEKLDVENEGLLIYDITDNDKTNKLNIVEVEDTQINKEIITMNYLIKLFEDNICELKPILKNKFAKYCSSFDKKYIETIIELCAENNIKAFSGFKVIIDGYITKGIITSDGILNEVEKYRINSQKIRENERKKRAQNSKQISSIKNSTFNNFEQRNNFDFDEFERKMNGWDEEEKNK